MNPSELDEWGRAAPVWTPYLHHDSGSHPAKGAACASLTRKDEHFSRHGFAQGQPCPTYISEAR